MRWNGCGVSVRAQWAGDERKCSTPVAGVQGKFAVAAAGRGSLAAAPLALSRRRVFGVPGFRDSAPGCRRAAMPRLVRDVAKIRSAAAKTAARNPGAKIRKRRRECGAGRRSEKPERPCGRHSERHPRAMAGRRHRRFRRHRRPARKAEGGGCDRSEAKKQRPAGPAARDAGIGRACEPLTDRTNRRGAPRGRRRGGRCRPGRGRRSPRRPRIRDGA